MFTDLLENNLKDAKAYDRIAGYFSSSILQIAGEAIEKMKGKVRVVCNSDLDVDDVKTAKLASESVRREWCDFKPEELPSNPNRFKRLYEFLKSGKMEVKVLPKDKFGLAHGKAGVFTLANGHRTSFLGSANATFSGWKLNYELVWEDDTEATVNWVQEEFDMLWNSQYAVPLAEYIVEDIKRISKRNVINTVEEWNEKNAEAGAVTVEAPINRQGFGLWEHQKYFIDHAFADHKKPQGARYILADEVGLGKTVQLAVSAELMALYGGKPILVIVPKTLLGQWQAELRDLLGIPSAVWNGKAWVDENDIVYDLAITKCPRKIGIVSQGIINNASDVCMKLKEDLLCNYYECVIVDEAHRARRKNLSDKKLRQSPDMNNLYAFLMKISCKTHSMLLATATPVQLYKIEAFDLLNVLSQANDSVLGDKNSYWRKPNENILRGLNLITGEEHISDVNEGWRWMADPMPAASENRVTYGRIRSAAEMSDDEFSCRTMYSSFPRNIQAKIKSALDDNFFGRYNPYIGHIVRRERAYLENTINPETNQPYLPKIDVNLLGESQKDSLQLTGYLSAAYEKAESFCESIQKRCKSAGLFKTLLLRRIGSSMIAGYITGNKMLNEWNCINEDDIEEDEESDFVNAKSDLKDLTKEETDILKTFVQLLGNAITDKHVDPKYNQVLNILNKGVKLDDNKYTAPWKNLGCIIFSQYFDTVNWIAKGISEELDIEIGVYAGGSKSGVYYHGKWHSDTRDNLKKMVKQRKIKIIVGTDAASEGLNLQTLGTLINFDLPWNPTRLEQRKGRIQRIGQLNDIVYVYNLRYRGSVEDRVHELLSTRMEGIYKMFGQIPDVLEDVWIDLAVGNIEEAKKKIDALPKKHPFAIKYHDNVGTTDWESCAIVLSRNDINKKLLEQW